MACLENFWDFFSEEKTRKPLLRLRGFLEHRTTPDRPLRRSTSQTHFEDPFRRPTSQTLAFVCLSVCGSEIFCFRNNLRLVGPEVFSKEDHFLARYVLFWGKNNDCPVRGIRDVEFGTSWEAEIPQKPTFIIPRSPKNFAEKK